MDQKSYPDILSLNIDIRYISRYFFRKGESKCSVKVKAKYDMSQVVLFKPANSVNKIK